MTPGSFTYRVTLFEGESEMATAERTFAANDDSPVAGGPSPDTDS